METFEQKLERVLSENVILVPYDFRWPSLFENEAKHLRSCLPPGCICRIEHFGSTAVPGLTAKPIVDMLVEVADLEFAKDQVAPILESQGYDYFWRPTFGDDGKPFYPWFIKRDSISGARTHHIHMVEHDFAGHWDRLYFRDYLIEHPEIAEEYGNLKARVAQNLARDRVAYTNSKTKFIVEFTEKAKSFYGAI